MPYKSGRMQFRGKDGAYYDDITDRDAANRRFEQQEKQNTLLQEQNNLIRQQQEAEELRRKQERQEQELNRKRKEKYAKFEKVFLEEIAPLMQSAGIKDPVAYYDKLQDLYKDSPIKRKEITLLDENKLDKLVITNDSEMDMLEYPSEIQEKLQNINNQIIKRNRAKREIKSINSTPKLLIGMLSCVFILTTIILISASVEFKYLLYTGFYIFLTGLLIYWISKPFNNKRLLKFQKELKAVESSLYEQIPAVNSEIIEYNKEVKEENSERENKIRNFEKKRIENFNYELEIALEMLAMQNVLLAVDIEELEYYNSFDYSLQFNEYPKDWQEKREQYYKNKRQAKAAQEGTEIFLDL